MLSKLKKLNGLFSKQITIKFAGLFLLMLVGIGLELLGIGAIPAFLSVLVSPKYSTNLPGAGRLLHWLNITSSKELIIFSGLTLLIVFLLKNGYLAFLSYVRSRFIRNRIVELGRRMFSAYLYASYAFHLNRNTEELKRNANVEVRFIGNQVLKPLLQFLLNSITSLAIIVLLLIIEPLVSVIVVGILGCAILLFSRITRRTMETRGQQEQKQRTISYKKMQEALGSLEVVKMLYKESFFINKFIDSFSEANDARQVKEFVSSLTRPVMEVIAVLSMIVVAFSAVIFGKAATSLIPTLGLFGVAIVRLQGSITTAVSSFTTLRYSGYAVDIVYNDLLLLDKIHEEPDYSVGAAHKDELHFNGQLDIDSVSFRYEHASHNALRDITLSIPAGTSAGIVGSTGAGKSTLINIILGLLEPTSGQVSVDGVNIFGRLRSWQPMIGYIPQDIYLLDETIKRNIALGIEDDEVDEQQLQKTVNIAHLDDLINKLADGWQTYVGERGVRLSGGQRQRIGIARALYHDPEVLVMDEATASLDTTTEKSVMQALNEARQGRTFIMIAHRLSTVKNCDTIYLLKNGRLVSEGSYDHLARHSEIFKQMIADTQ